MGVFLIAREPNLAAYDMLMVGQVFRAIHLSTILIDDSYSIT